MSKLREIRLSKGLSQVKLTQLTGITPQAISNMESGKVYPYPGWRKKLAKALEVDEKTLFPEVEADA